MKNIGKLKLTQLSTADLKEREMCRLLGMGTPGCCQCSCTYEGEPGGASTSSNNSANNANGYTSVGYTGDVCCNGGSGGGSDIGSGGTLPVHNPYAVDNCH